MELQVAPLARKCVEINQNIYFIFEIESTDESEDSDYGHHNAHFWTLWEAYFIKGQQADKNSAFIIREITNWENIRKVARRSDFMGVNLTVVAPVHIYSILI